MSAGLVELGRNMELGYLATIEDRDRRIAELEAELVVARQSLKRIGRASSSLGATLQREGELAELKATPNRA